MSESEGQVDAVRRFLEISTEHLPESVMNGAGGIARRSDVIAVTYTYGAWMNVPDDVDEWLEEHGYVSAEDSRQLRRSADDEPKGWPACVPEIEAVMRYARSLGCDWVRLDADAETTEALATYEWGGAKAAARGASVNRDSRSG